MSEEGEKKLYDHYLADAPEVDGVIVIEEFSFDTIRRPSELQRGARVR